MVARYINVDCPIHATQGVHEAMQSEGLGASGWVLAIQAPHLHQELRIRGLYWGICPSSRYFVWGRGLVLGRMGFLY